MNKIYIIIICIIGILTVNNIVEAQQCKQHGQMCMNSADCTTHYCRGNRCIYYGESSDDAGIYPCAAYDCQQGSTCVLDQVQCVKAPCLPIARCAQTVC